MTLKSTIQQNESVDGMDGNELEILLQDANSTGQSINRRLSKKGTKLSLNDYTKNSLAHSKRGTLELEH